MKYFRWIALTLMIIALILPLITFLLKAFARGWFFPQIIPRTWSLAAWERLFSPQSDLLPALLNSGIIALTVTGVALAIGFPAARVLGIGHFPGKRWILLVLLAPALVPPLAVSMGLSTQFLRLGLSGTWIGVSIAHLIPVLPYVILTLSGLFARYDLRYEEQARSLGAGSWAIFRRITLPMLWPGVIAAGLFAFLISWSQYLLTFLIGGGRVITLPILLFASTSGGDNAVIAALSLVMIAPALLVLIFASRSLEQGTIR
ncbi:MAG: ABC transporter permease subunit [Anaerolineae bacterium]|jgi:putative spermidine/putrescine transport system permease protein|nr:ABC transporter permease subunit [Anaerolineae bacterium]